MVSFHVGQKVVVAFPYEEHIHLLAASCGETLPEPNVIYSIREIEPPDPDDGMVCIRLHEIVNPSGVFQGECAFNSQRFRPVIERKTSIEIFQAMLITPKVETSA